ncbi:MAG: hypothetical protein KF847_11435 [Pirellulales bacterium]|nr:hypothetical protein [Pirellulales bacterium]
MNAAVAPHPVPVQPEPFVDRRAPNRGSEAAVIERRQFANQYDDLSPEGAELARAIDGYKLQHRRRFINCDELLGVVKGLGYRK